MSTVETAIELNGNGALLDDTTRPLITALINEDQGHLFQNWAPPGEHDADKRKLLDQITHLDKSYAGGLVQYISNARRLLQDSKNGVNPFEGYIPEVPDGESMDFGSRQFRDLEQKGVEEAGQTAFVLVAGGLGERLGYSGIKLALPSDSASNRCFLQLYIEYILALEAKAQDRFQGRKLPLVIMTSDDTHARTQDLLDSNNYFGAAADQIIILKQEKVACLSDNDAHLALSPSDPYSLQTKPHGHGDVHMLLHSSGIAEKWESQGFKWVCFFQDTNAQVVRTLAAAIGVSAVRDFDVNSLAVPRKAKEAIGAITRLKNKETGKEITINVEYNQLDPLLRATVNPEGDVNDTKTGFSPFPGNINQIVLKLSTYVAELNRHGGVISEFVNPKYTDASRTAFKSSTRLECMMQDFPKSLPDGSKVGFTVINQVWAAYSPVKNSPADAAAKAASGNPSHSATTGEFDVYETNCRMLQMVGVDVEEPTTTVSYNGISGLYFWPRVSWSPFFAVSFDDLEHKIRKSNTKLGIHIGRDSVLVIHAGNVVLDGLDVRPGSACAIETPDPTAPTTIVIVSNVVVENAGWRWEPIRGNSNSTSSGGGVDGSGSEEEMIRGFRVVRNETQYLSSSS